MHVRAAITQNGSGGLEWIFGGGRTIPLIIPDLHRLSGAFSGSTNCWIYPDGERISVKVVTGGQYEKSYDNATGTYVPGPSPDPDAAYVIHDDNGWEECLDSATVSALTSGIGAILAGGQAPAFVPAPTPVEAPQESLGVPTEISDETPADWETRMKAKANRIFFGGG